MKMTKNSFLRKTKGFINIIGTCENEHGEEFLIYVYGSLSNFGFFVTGDELDWTTEAYKYEKGRLVNEFPLSLVENQAIGAVINGWKNENNQG